MKGHNHILLSIKNSKKIINVSGTSYPIIKEVAIDELDFQPGVDHFTFLWGDAAMSIKDIRALEYPKRVNHLPDISQITRKNKLALNLNSMKVHLPKQFDFYPETWLMPQELHKILKKHQKGKFYILKPENNCQGKGISIVDNPNKIDKQTNLVVQEYIKRPLLVDGLKFDLRIYVLVTCVSPLRVYLYQEGLARFATEPWNSPDGQNLENNFSHLTNYAINKNHQNFDLCENHGHKRLISSVFDREQLQGHNGIMPQIKQIVIKTIMSALPALENAYTQCKKTDLSSCFQLLGFDVMLDHNRKAYLIQVNQNPSLSTETAIDHKLKSALVRNILKMVSGGLPNMFEDKTENKVKLKDRHELNNIGNFERIYPCKSLEETESYDEVLIKSHEIYKQKFGINIIRNLKRKEPLMNKGSKLETSTYYEKWPREREINSSMGKHQANNFQQTVRSSFYTKEKMQNIYKARNNSRYPKTSMAKRKPQF